MSPKVDLDEAISIIMSYECDIRDCKNQFGIDLVKIGFCQGSVYKNALRYIEKRKLEPEVTEEWIEKKGVEFYRWINPKAHTLLECVDFIRSLVEEIIGK